MRITQTITREGANLVLTLTEEPSSRVLSKRVWEGAAKYLRPTMPNVPAGYIALLVPEKAGLNVKPATWSEA